MPTATTKTYQVTYEILDTWAKVGLIKDALMPLGFAVDTHSWRDEQGADHTLVTFDNPTNTNRFQVELGSAKNVVVYDKGWLYNYTSAEALDRYNV